ncbi:AUR3 [Symbiodinium sp. CCMP2456]|nr:AUR3 [Symbiodinium sp. CCMP2456]
MKAVPKQKIRDQGMLAYLMREIRTQMQLTHPCIVQLHYYFEDEHHVLLLLEYANGGSLFSLLRQHGQLPEAEAARYYVDVALALMHLHKHGIVHRDLKPENILMCGDPPTKAKLADFGWCAELEKGGAPRNTFCGTWDYLSPEMVENQPHNNKVDIWATGVLLFEMLTGRAPFSAPSPAKATDRIRKVDLQVPGYVPPLAADLMQKLLVREPAMRPGLDALKHNWIALQVPGTSLDLTKSTADVAVAKQLELAARPPTPNKVVQPLAPLAATKEVTVDRGPGPSSAYAEAPPESSPNTASPASTLSVAPAGVRHRGYSDGDGSNHSVSSASTVQIPRPKPSVMPWSDNTPTSIKEGGSRSSSKEASELGTPAEAKRALDFGLPDTKERGDAFHLSQADQLGFGFGICSRSGSKDSTSSARLGGKDASPSSPWSESETFAAVRDWLKSPTAIANDLGLDTRRERSDTEPSGIFQDALSRTHAGVKSLTTKPDADPLSQTSSISRAAHADGRILPKPKQKMASPTASRRFSADTELGEASIDISVFARQAKQQQPLAQPMESVDDVTKCHNALDSLQERLQRKWEAMVAG